jgi:beta-galactosidase/beta-glucuronidase
VTLGSDQVIYDVKNVSVGLRTVYLIREMNPINLRFQSFKFNVNGHDVFAKGANYVPHNYFITQGLRTP